MRGVVEAMNVDIAEGTVTATIYKVSLVPINSGVSHISFVGIVFLPNCARTMLHSLRI